ncbi:tectonin beta-propeller repeat-containing protein 2-like isoform X2 [Homarus americanus]|uniref:tectonin beta-propeller repeat-containing protein 2-like isoform X2 n=1 Tax=Homarus americanus TaxID=6706 RepID=UPI001C44D389|nr:tectonin beta-propeller repeat-containing protein 2-like isoform X2 [Homarus americanus]
MDSEENPVWTEWLPLNSLLDQLPQQFQRGLGAADLQLTCLATIPQHLVMGTNVGLVYLAHLPSINLMRLKCENPLSAVSSVASVRTVDDMIAAGTVDGTITVFQLPRVANIDEAFQPSSSPNTNILRSKGITGVQPTVKRFTVGNVHNGRITSMTWSRNGMRLFSGDADGVVSVVEINYQTSECTAKKLMRETSSITQLSYNCQHLAVSTLERTLVYSLTQNSAQQVGQKPRKYLGLFGCTWSPSMSHSDAVLFTSRPGLRLWSSTSEGEVLHTHIIKELPETTKAHLLNPSFEKPREGEKFSFGLLHMLGLSHIVSYNPHWLFIIDVNSLKVLTFSGQFRHITGLAVSDQEIFVLEGSRNVSCLSIQPINIGGNISPSAARNTPFPETQNLLDIGARIVIKGSGLIGQIARVSSSVAARVSEHANSSIITGQEIKNRKKQDISKSSPMDGPSLHTAQLPGYPLAAATEGEKQGHKRSSSSGLIQESGSLSSPSVHPRMVQSVGSFFPSLLSSPLLISTLGKTPSLQDVHITVFQGELEVVGDLEKIVTSSEIVAQEGEESEPIVMRDKSRKRARKKMDAVPSPDSVSVSSFKSTSEMSDTPSGGTPSSPSMGQTQLSTDFSLSPSTNSSQSLQPLDENIKMLVDQNQEESDYTPGTGRCEKPNTEESEENYSTASIGFKSVVDTRTYDDFKNDIQQKESLLADILDLGCLKMDHEVIASEEETSSTGGYEEPPQLEREHSFDSTSCSTPSTLKELSPAPDSSSCSDFYAQFYPGNNSFSSVDSGTDAHGHHGVEGATKINIGDPTLMRDDGDEHLESNVSEDRLSCLSYGPPSGSSLLSLGNRPQGEGHDQSVGESRNVLTVTDSSEVADISWSYSASDVQECYEYDKEEMTGGWLRHKLPSNVVSLTVSENSVVFVDNRSCLFFKDAASENKAWKKVKLTAKASQISYSPSGNILWIEFGRNVYAISNPKLETFSTCRMIPIARDVRQMCVDEEVTWYISQLKQVCVQPSLRHKSPHIVHCQEFQMAKVVCHSQVVWGLTESGQLVFRVGVTAQSPFGHDWGVMDTPGGPLLTMALGPGQKGWIVDAKGRVYFRLGVCAKYPQGSDSKWWQVVTSDYMMDFVTEEGSSVMLASSSRGIWLAEQESNRYSFHEANCTGHVWTVFSEEVWSTVCAEALYTDQGAICCLSPLGQLFVVNPNTACSVPFDLPKNECVVSVSQRPEAMWVLTAAGNIFIRVGLSAKSLHGSHWEQLDLNQIGDVHLCHISCGMEVVWGVDTRGGVYMRQGPLTPSSNESLPPAWIQVDPVSLKGNAVFTKVYVGMKLHVVWAVDSCRCVYVREAIFPELPIGLSWVPVDGLLALHLSISENEVYALTPNGEVFKRIGVTETNYIGDAWQKIPGNIAKISVTIDNCLWGLNGDGHICQHSVFQVSDSPPDGFFNRSQTFSISSETSDWEVL